MNDPADIPANSETDARWRALRNLVHSLAIAVLILTGTLFVFLFRQAMNVRNNTREMDRFLQQYNQSDLPEMIERIRVKLDDYRQNDPGFTPIYVKYFGTNPPPRNAVSAKVAPASTNSPTNK